MNHLEVWKLETYQSPTEAAWFGFIADVERLAKLETLDGDQDSDGYSLDFAYDAFRAGQTAEQYAASIRP